MTDSATLIERALRAGAPHGTPLLDFISGDEPPSALSGLMGPARSLVTAFRIAASPSSPALVVVPDEKDLQTTASDLETFLNTLDVEKEVLTFPAFAVNILRGLRPHPKVAAARAAVLAALGSERSIVVVASARALGYRLIRPELMRGASIELVAGENFEARVLERDLVGLGFRFEDPVTGAGEFARRDWSSWETNWRRSASSTRKLSGRREVSNRLAWCLPTNG